MQLVVISFVSRCQKHKLDELQKKKRKNTVVKTEIAQIAQDIS